MDVICIAVETKTVKIDDLTKRVEVNNEEKGTKYKTLRNSLRQGKVEVSDVEEGLQAGQ